MFSRGCLPFSCVLRGMAAFCSLNVSGSAGAALDVAVASWVVEIFDLKLDGGTMFMFSDTLYSIEERRLFQPSFF